VYYCLTENAGEDSDFEPGFLSIGVNKKLLPPEREESEKIIGLLKK
jgi:hypothetical protein